MAQKKRDSNSLCVVGHIDMDACLARPAAQEQRAPAIRISWCTDQRQSYHKDNRMKSDMAIFCIA